MVIGNWHIKLWVTGTDQTSLSFWGVLPPKFRGTSFRPPKRHILRDFTSNELSCVKSTNRSDLYASLRKKGINKKSTKTLYFTHMPRSPQWMDLYQIWFWGSPRGPNQMCGILLQSAHGFRFCEGSKFAISHWLGRSPSRAACDNIFTRYNCHV